jgi:Mg2+ and Co2+ transporter CorA
MTIVWLLTYLTAVVAIVMTWRGLWGLMDEYLWPKNPRRSYWASFIIGFIIIVIVLALVQP